MQADLLTDIVSNAASAIAAAVPSQAPLVSVSGVRKTATGSRPISGSFRAILTSQGFTDVIGEYSSSSQIGNIALIIPAHGDCAWFDETPPTDGDTLTLEDGSKYSIISVNSTRGLYFKVVARKC